VFVCVRERERYFIQFGVVIMPAAGGTETEGFLVSSQYLHFVIMSLIWPLQMPSILL
jgi:hypothetical protein